MLKFLFESNNQQVTKVFIKPLGTSETIRFLTKVINRIMNKKNYVLKKNDHIIWDEWFAGVVDGDGYFYINKNKQISFELTTSVFDLNILYTIKNKLGAGSIKPRSGSNSFRYRVKARLIIENIVDRLNGRLHNPGRRSQFEKVCAILNISIKKSSSILETPNGYLAGLIDSDGTISISISKTNAVTSQKPGKEGNIARLSQSKGFNQMYVKITSVYKEPLLIITKSYKFGTIYIEKKNFKNRKPKDQYHWIIRSYEDFSLLYENLKQYPLKSSKMHRIRLSLKYFNYKQLKFHLKDPNTIEYKIWLKFCNSWFKYNF
uniref:LAGLIDADG homing endonuclease n=1 Tax=Ulva compressa TaxID=63659 RepID=A0A8E6HTC9_ULVCO|nr:LAGLIDADG homing endonuclease [Ulva compressa]